MYERPWWVGLIFIGGAVVLIGLILFASALIRSPGSRSGEGKSLTDREFDARQEIDSRFMTNTGDRVDFEADRNRRATDPLRVALANAA
jgi:hypothetical protein